MLTTAILAKGP